MLWIAINDRAIFCAARRFFDFSTTTETIHRLLLHWCELFALAWPCKLSFCQRDIEGIHRLQHKCDRQRLKPLHCRASNVPQFRPIEDFWRFLKQLFYKKGWAAKDEEVLKRRIKYCLGKVDTSKPNLKSNLRKTRVNGASSLNQ